MLNTPTLDAAHLRECFEVSDDWRLIWRERPRRHFDSHRAWRTFITRYAGKEAGFAHQGCRKVNVKPYGPLLVARILWCIHHGEIEATKGVGHIDGDRLNNHLDNLQLVDLIAPGEAHHRAKVTEDEVRRIRELSAKGVSQSALARAYNMHQTNVNAIVHRRSWGHVG